MGKYEKFDVSYEGRRLNWPFWLIPIIAAFLIVIIGLFIFVTLDSDRRLGCLLGCEDRDDIHGGKEDPTLITPRAESKVQHDSSESKANMKVSGKISFPTDKIPETLPENSNLKVKFEDVILQDAPSKVLGSAQVDLSGYKKGQQLEYTIECKKPSEHGMYSVSAVLNVGWKANGDEWLRKGDFLTDTVLPVKIEEGKDDYTADIELVKY